ncbi:hypothetical protein MRB53_038432 [Persea americana]|nr:hypothetical protein MRB53_038432 [Persea americana]
MVDIYSIRNSNARYAAQRRDRFIHVYVGATRGIGAASLEMSYQITFQSTFYVLGRSSASFAMQKEALEKLNPSNRIEFLEVEVSTIEGVDAACKHIAGIEKRVDFLYMSCGYLPIAGPSCKHGHILNTTADAAADTKEGREVCMMLSYYSRMRLIYNLLPLLRLSANPKVLSVLYAGGEGLMNDNDLGLESNWHWRALTKHANTMMSISLRQLSATEEKVTFIHAFPGVVATDKTGKFAPLPGASTLWIIMLAIIRWLFTVLPILFGIPVGECGERQAYHLTSDKFGSGFWRVNANSEPIVKSNAAMDKYSEDGWPQKIWNHTVEVWEKAKSKE